MNLLRTVPAEPDYHRDVTPPDTVEMQVSCERDHAGTGLVEWREWRETEWVKQCIPMETCYGPEMMSCHVLRPLVGSNEKLTRRLPDRDFHIITAP